MEREEVELRQLNIGYITKSKTKTVQANINATIRRGQLTCLIGPNGVGKSTLLRTLSAFQPKLGGEIMMDGREIGLFTPMELSRQLSVVLTERLDVKNMTVRELVSMGRAPYTGFWGSYSDDDRRVVDESLNQIGIAELSDRMVDTLSDGERQKVMIAKALAQQTPVIYMDEPTAFLDFPSKVEVMLLLRRICQVANKTIFLSTHDMELALQTADCIWLIDRSEGLSIGTPRELADQGKLSRFIEHPGIHFNIKTLTIHIDKTV